MEELRDGDPRAVGPYRIVGRLGGGGMGQVFLGRSRGGRPVAVKVVRPELADDREFRRRFAQEVRAARRVGGFYTAQVVDADPEAAVPWLVTAYVEGPSLARAVQAHGPLPERGVRVLGAGLAEGLAAIHRCGLVHRDLKPGNVILADDGPRVIDFGIARALDGTPSTKVIGTPGFMSPEQVHGRGIGPASDVFCLGAVLVHAATGNGPFGDHRPEVVLYRVVHEPPDLTGLPAALHDPVTRCLAKDPADRPDLAAVLDTLAAPDVPPGTPGGGLAFGEHGLVPADEGVRKRRELVLDYLRGRMTYEEQPWMFDEDVLLFAVARLKDTDRAWADAQVASPLWPAELRESLAVMLRFG